MKIHIEDNLRIGFPGRDASFSEGVEIGMLATLMALGLSEFARTVSSQAIEQARVLAQKLGYHVAAIEIETPELVRLSFRNRALRPKLKLAASRN